MTESPLVVTLKGGGNHADPWIVVRADTTQQLVERLNEVVNAGVDGAVVAAQQAFTATYGGAPANPVQTVQQGLGGQVVQAQPTPTQASYTPAPQVSAPPAQVAPAGGAHSETDRFQNTWTFNHPKAPQTPHGPAVHRSWTTQAGKASNRWVDPRAKAVAGNYAKGVREDPADLWPGDWADPVWKLDQ